MLNEDSLKIIGEKTDKEFIDNYDAINQTAKILLNKGLVKESYIEAIKKREESFPTGLEFKNYGIAIPHTDPEHVINEAILINILEKPIKFEQMASEGLYTDVNIIVMLAIKNKENQVPYLQALIELFQDKEKVNTLLECKNDDIIEETFNKYLKESI
ncbi:MULTISPECIES: PTS sugar transporter subunit IIA [Anaerococcus]|uniref:PTS sugar transporter subunit IIA n=1 Tax=Anaerococcus TaxID=165779 RepID=UPI0027BAF07B|nr:MULTISPECIES: PTS sugar transporter subunit IIA [Anaerococcus]MDU2598984.1 PTS sugar transporter subunit IIA [Anaerococcus sp.]MDU3176816.1 PTS sugar transporter subunit IIA [Anaerococcus sp.]MDU7412128.1 PTS sugar transporter subunit IIA [Anaerococcus sp.]